MTIIKRVLCIIFTLIFFAGITVGMIGRAMCTRDNENYQALQSELFAPDEIATVLYDESLHQIYVCYNDASYVNVYSENGEFLWAVSTPYLRNVYFELSDNKLIIYNSVDVYIYNSSNGAFVQKESSENLELNYDWEDETTDIIEPNEFYFDTYQVYRAEQDGALNTIVARPWWYWIFNFDVCFCVSFCGAVGLGIIIFTEKRKDYRKAQEEPSPIVIKNSKAKFILKYFCVTTVVQIIYAVLNVIIGIFLNGILCIGIIPLAIHFIISNIVFYNMLDRIRITEGEKKILDYWKTANIGSFIIAFLSVIIVVALA